jgi:hypothetical protein
MEKSPGRNGGESKGLLDHGFGVWSTARIEEFKKC